MPIRRMLEFLLPREKRFIQMLASQADLLLDASTQYHEFVKHYNTLTEKERVAKMDGIKRIEREGDRAMRELIDAMHETFITPIDREDMLNISHRLEQTLDMTYSATRMAVMYKIKRMPKEMTTFSEMLRDSCRIIRHCMHHLKDYSDTRRSIEAICRIENESDRLYYECINALFNNRNDPEEIIKFKDMYDVVEETIDSCEKAGKMIERTVLKHA